MKIGLVVAVVREMKSFLESEGDSESMRELQVGSHTVYITQIGVHEVYAVKSGLGKIDAAASTELLINHFGCKVILNYGVTGAIDPALKVRDLFVVPKTVNYDYDVSGIDPVQPYQYEEFPDIYIPLDQELVQRALLLDPALKTAVCASGDKFIDDAAQKRFLFEELKAGICDMELAAIARICFLNHARCFSVKCISDEVDGDGNDYEKNVICSGQHAFSFMKKFILAL